MRNIAVIGTGYVGLVTAVALAEVGHTVIGIDINEEKVSMLNNGESPIYEPGIEELLRKNLKQKKLHFINSVKGALNRVDVLYIAVGTPPKEDGKADLTFIDKVIEDISSNIQHDLVVVTKSTVPVGTNEYIQNSINSKINKELKVAVVSNPEFLREGSAVYDTFNGDRIVIGADNKDAAELIEEINRPFNIPVFKTDVRSAEMIKYASNAFLATKISFINEIANICEKTGADIEDVANGMGLDQRIGNQFLRAGIGYGGSCFPKDTKALVQIAGNVEHDFELLKSVIEVNNKQQVSLVNKAKKRLGSLEGKRIALLGLAFKPNTDDMREAASIMIARELVIENAEVVGFDPIAIENAKKILPNEVIYTKDIHEALDNADLAMILTEWDEIKDFPLSQYKKLMKTSIVFDGRNCLNLDQIAEFDIEYHSIGRKVVTQKAYQPN